MAWLEVVGPKGEAVRFPVEGRCVLGREEDCSVRDPFLDRPWVSRRHACVESRDGVHVVTDLGSRNGTTLNGIPVDGWRPLRDGDVLDVGGVGLCFREEKDHPSGPGLDETQEDLPMAGVLSRRKMTTWGGGEASGHEAAARTLHALVRMLSNFGRSLDPDEMFDHLLTGLFEVFPQASRGFVATRDGASGTITIRKVKQRQGTLHEGPSVSRTVIDRVMDEQEAILSLDVQRDGRFDPTESMMRAGLGSVLCAPLVDSDGAVVGVLELDVLDGARGFGDEDLEVFACVAPQAALALGLARLHEDAVRHRVLDRDLQLARRVQRALLPAAAPEIKGYAFHAYYEAAYEVGGDYYDYVPLPDGRWAILLADAFGKGVSASLLATKLSSEIRSDLATSPTPAEAVSRMSRSLGAMEGELPCRFVTLALLALDPVRHEIEIVNAGHLAPVLRRADGRVEEVGDEWRGPALGMIPDTRYRSNVVRLEPGDAVVMFSDGLSEARDAAGDLFGTGRIRDALARGEGPAADLGETLIQEVLAYAAGRDQADDMCMVCVGRDGAPRRSRPTMAGRGDG